MQSWRQKSPNFLLHQEPLLMFLQAHGGQVSEGNIHFLFSIQLTPDEHLPLPLFENYFLSELMAFLLPTQWSIIYPPTRYRVAFHTVGLFECPCIHLCHRISLSFLLAHQFTSQSPLPPCWIFFNSTTFSSWFQVFLIFLCDLLLYQSFKFHPYFNDFQFQIFSTNL